MATINFCIDNRELHLIPLIKKLGLDPEIESLDVGDVVIDGFTFERKTIDDLHASIIDGRYKEQKLRASANGINMIYIIEGSFLFSDASSNSKMTTGCVINMILRDKIQVLFTSDLNQTATLIKSMFDRVTSDPQKYKTIVSEDYVANICLKKKENVDPATCFVMQLACIPGISIKKARAIIENNKGNFGNIAEMCTFLKNTKPEVFCKNTPGIGKKIAASIYVFCGT